VGSYLAYRPEIYPKAHENPRAFSCISGPIFLESFIQCPCGVGLHQRGGKIYGLVNGGDGDEVREVF